MAKHAKERKLLKYPISTYVYMYKNRWYYFTKPKLRKKIDKLNQSIKRRLCTPS
jgi:hypothetical protein